MSSQTEPHPEADSVARARASANALAGNVTHGQPTTRSSSQRRSLRSFPTTRHC